MNQHFLISDHSLSYEIFVTTVCGSKNLKLLLTLYAYYLRETEQNLQNSPKVIYVQEACAATTYVLQRHAGRHKK